MTTPAPTHLDVEEVVDLIIQVATSWYLYEKLQRLRVEKASGMDRPGVFALYTRWDAEKCAAIKKLLRNCAWDDVLSSDAKESLDLFAREWLNGNVVTIHNNAMEFIEHYGTLASLCTAASKRYSKPAAKRSAAIHKTTQANP